MSQSVLICLATGSEELETVTTFDLLARAGISATLASVDADAQNLVISCSRGVRLLADAPLSLLADGDYNALVLPGGIAGARCFASSPLLVECIRQFYRSGRIVAAICATPARVLVPHQLFPEANMTGFPALKDEIPAQQWRDKRLYFDERFRLLTSQGPGTSIDFALKIIELLSGKAQAASVASQLVLAAGIYNYQQ